jgi:hypothetical protein
MADRLIDQEQSNGRVAVALQRADQLVAEPVGEPITFAAPGSSCPKRSAR